MKRVSNEGPSVQVTVRLPPSWLDEVDREALAMSRPGLVISRADVMRHALALFLKIEDK